MRNQVNGRSKSSRTRGRRDSWAWPRDNVNQNPHPVAEDATRVGHPEVEAGRSVLVEGGVLLDEFFLFFRHVVEGVNRIGGAGRNASATVDAALGIYIHLS